jgi:putative transposase
MPLRRAHTKQLALPLPNAWGGRRAGAGRKGAAGVRPSVPHRPREPHRNAHPVLVTMRARAGLPPFREQALGSAIREAIRAASASPSVRGGFRVVHFSIQRDHLHLVVEAHDASSLARGMQGLGVRVARAINGLLDIRGRVMGDRFHSRELRSPREVRSALVYVLMNFKKHARGPAASMTHGVDAFSSAPWFDGFRRAVGPPPPHIERPVARPHTWLASNGWRRCGLVGPHERPRIT